MFPLCTDQEVIHKKGNFMSIQFYLPHLPIKLLSIFSWISSIFWVRKNIRALNSLTVLDTILPFLHENINANRYNILDKFRICCRNFRKLSLVPSYQNTIITKKIRIDFLIEALFNDTNFVRTRSAVLQLPFMHSLFTKICD